ncbi:MAG: two-component regulator propeller domain-containing protein [Salinivirgaceae bacterium]
MRSKLLFGLLFLLPFAQMAENKTNVHFISRREGLSNGAVNTIVKDAEGYIWFGTWNGLNRYDGSNMVTYLPGSNTNSIHNHVIRGLYPTEPGPIWMLTNKGIGLYDNIHDRFTSYFTKESEQINYEDDIAICYSKSFGTLVSVFGRGIFHFDSITTQFNKIDFDEGSQQLATSIKRIHLIESRAYSISSDGKLYEVLANHLQEVLKLPLTGILSTSISVNINRRPYILITQRAGAALLVDLEAKEVQLLSIPNDIITSFSLSKEKERIWVGTEKGKIYRLNLQNRNFLLFNILTGSFIDNPIATRILSIYETDTDLLWIGTDGNGVYALNFTDFPNKSLSSNQLTYPIVRSILVTRKKDVLIGTKGGGIDIFDANGRRIKSISVKNGLNNNSVLSFHEHNDGSIWVGTDGKGVDIISADYKTIRNFPRDFKNSQSIEFASVYRILNGSDGRIYLGTSGFGVILIELDTKNGTLPISCEQLILDKSIERPNQQKQIVYAITEEKPGTIWIGTRGLGLYRYNTITKRVMGQYSTLSQPNAIKNDDILSLFTELNGDIWVGSSNGLFGIKPITADSINVIGIGVQSDVSSTSIHAIQLDDLGNLWVTTNQGLSIIDPSRLKVRSFDLSDGLNNIEYSDGASFYDTNTGRIYVGGTMGVDIVQTNEIKNTTYFPPIAINQLFIKNNPVAIGNDSPLISRINHQKSLKLAYNQNSITFYVSPLVYWGQERYRISYWLKNFDNGWVVNPTNQPINYSNLAWGIYYLQLRVSDENGNWSGETREIEILIEPPLWATSWAIVSYILLIIAIQVFIFVTYRKRAARKKEVALKEFQKEKEAELQSYKIEFFTNVAHEFRTPLTLINSHIHALLEDTRNTLEIRGS